MVSVKYLIVLVLRILIPGFSFVTDAAAMQTLVYLLQFLIDPCLEGSQ